MVINNLVRENKYENYLLVEGDEDRDVFDQLLARYQIRDQLESKGEKVEIRPKGGIQQLLNTLKTELKASEQRRLGIIVDSDDIPINHWKAIWQRLKEFGYIQTHVLSQPDPLGSVLSQEGYPTVGIWLMPDNRDRGMMEDFLGWLVPRDDLLWPMAGDVVQKVIERDRRFRESYRSKACIHTWLAWQKDPGTSLSMAVNKHYINANAPHAQQFITWIRRLFALESA
jgi:hypothetical protein